MRGVNVEKSFASEPATPGKTYVYDKRRYFFDVQVPVIVAVIAFFAAASFVFAGVIVPIAVGVMLLCVYIVFNTLIAKAYPQTVEIGDGEIRFTSFGRTDAFLLDGLTRMQVRENGMTHNAYVRINGGGLVRGRYFVGCNDLYDEEGLRALDLYQFFLDTEARLDPDNLRVRSRRMS